MLGLAKRGAETVPLNKVTQLGKLGSDQYIAIGGKEYVLGAEEVSDATELAARTGQVFVAIPREIHDDFGASMVVGSRLLRAHPLPKGAYAAQVAKAERRAAAMTPAMQPVDVLALPALAPRSGWILPALGGPASAPALNPTGAGIRGHQAARGRAILQRLQSKGIELSVVSGHLMVKTAGGKLTTGLRDVIERSAPLLVGWLSGQPALCQLPHKSDAPEATTVLLGGLLVCDEHAEEVQ